MDDPYKQLCQTMAQRGGRYPGMDIPEFYPMVQELFSPDEAAIAAVMPPKPVPLSAIAKEMNREEKEVEPILERMADKGLCSSFAQGGARYYVGVPFVPGIFEFQFMRGTRTDRDRRLARLIHDYKEAVDRTRGPRTITFPSNRVIPVEETIGLGSRVHTYSQVTAYLERYDPISVSTCFCRHEGKLLNGPNDIWIHPNGTVFFTDPHYKRPYWKRGPKEMEECVYRVTANDKQLTRIIADLKQPNGIIGTPDGKLLYVADIGAGKTYRYEIQPDGAVAGKHLFCELGSDGMTIDNQGNVYLTGKGVSVFSPEGKKIEQIDVPEGWTANVCFGGKDQSTLFITASKGFYGIQTLVKGAGSQ